MEKMREQMRHLQECAEHDQHEQYVVRVKSFVEHVAQRRHWKDRDITPIPEMTPSFVKSNVSGLSTCRLNSLIGHQIIPTLDQRYACTYVRDHEPFSHRR